VARVITFLVDVMTGIPSIVAGLFALALLVLLFGPAFRAGIGGSIALSLLMITDGRALVGGDDAAGSRRPPRGVVRPRVPKWRTVIARSSCRPRSAASSPGGARDLAVIGETAPLLVVAGSTDA
jgi:phosphate transport system permease protein